LDIQVSNLNAAMAQQEKAIRRSDLLPHASLAASDSITRYNLEALIGISIPGVPANIGPYQAIYAGPTFNFPIFDLTLLRRYQASGHLTIASRADERSTREQTVLLTVSEYMAHLRAVAGVRAAESRVNLARELAVQAHDLESSGVATQIDVSRAEVRLREEQQSLVDEQREVQTTLFALRRILNVPDRQPLQFSDADTFFQTPELDIPQPLETALKSRPELASLVEQQKAAVLDQKAAFDNSLPKLKFDGGWNEQGRTPQTLHPGYVYRFSLDVPIFTGGRLRAERQEANLSEQRSSRNLALVRNRVTEQVRDGEVELSAAKKQVDLGRQQVQLAKDEVTLSQGRFQAGVTDNIEVVSAQDALARANDAEISALYRYNTARAELARAVGSIEDIYTRP
jgi:outer membrane protein TolC